MTKSKQVKNITDGCIVLWWKRFSVQPFWVSSQFLTLCGEGGLVSQLKQGGHEQYFAFQQREHANAVEGFLQIHRNGVSWARTRMDRFAQLARWVDVPPDDGLFMSVAMAELVRHAYVGKHRHILLAPVQYARCAKCLVNLDYGLEHQLIQLGTDTRTPWRVTRGRASSAMPEKSWWNKDGLFIGPGLPVSWWQEWRQEWREEA